MLRIILYGQLRPMRLTLPAVDGREWFGLFALSRRFSDAFNEASGHVAAEGANAALPPPPAARAAVFHAKQPSPAATIPALLDRPHSEPGL
jgi:hypothetical protein